MIPASYAAIVASTVRCQDTPTENNCSNVEPNKKQVENENFDDELAWMKQDEPLVPTGKWISPQCNPSLKKFGKKLQEEWDPDEPPPPPPQPQKLEFKIGAHLLPVKFPTILLRNCHGVVELASSAKGNVIINVTGLMSLQSLNMLNDEYLKTEKLPHEVFHIKEFLAFAHQFDYPVLICQCIKKFSLIISLKNCHEVFRAGSRLSVFEVKKMAVDFIAKRFEKIEDNVFNQLDADCLAQVVAKDDVASTELAIFNRVVGWGEEECARLNYTSEHEGFSKLCLNKVLASVVRHIRFGLMTPAEFEIVKRHEVLAAAEVKEVETYFTQSDALKLKIVLSNTIFNYLPRRPVSVTICLDNEPNPFHKADPYDFNRKKLPLSIIKIRTKRDLYLHGIRLYEPFMRNGGLRSERISHQYIAMLSIEPLNGEWCISKSRVVSVANPPFFSFLNKLMLKCNVSYIVKVAVTDGISSHGATKRVISRFVDGLSNSKEPDVISITPVEGCYVYIKSITLGL